MAGIRPETLPKTEGDDHHTNTGKRETAHRNMALDIICELPKQSKQHA